MTGIKVFKIIAQRERKKTNKPSAIPRWKFVQLMTATVRAIEQRQNNELSTLLPTTQSKQYTQLIHHRMHISSVVG
jgi:hypothetical protein